MRDVKLVIVVEMSHGVTPAALRESIERAVSNVLIFQDTWLTDHGHRDHTENETVFASWGVGKTMDNSQYALIDIGRYGSMLHELPYLMGTSTVTGHLSSYDKDPDKILERFTSNIIEGAFIIDKRGLFGTEGFVSDVIRAPVVDVRLQDGYPDTPAVSEWFAESLARSGMGLAMVGGLTAVSPGDYTKYWAERGARVGIIQKGEILWQN